MASVRALSPLHSHTERFARGDGVELALERWGDADAPPVIFAHGFGQTRAAWTSSAARLADAGFQAVAVDGRGHGESGRNPASSRYEMAQFIDDLAALTRTFEQPPILVGASMGGLLGLAVQGTQRLFAALVLVDITPRWEHAGVERILDFMGAHPDGFASLEQAAQAIATYLPHRPRKSPAALAGLLRRGSNGRWHWHWDPRLLDEIGRDGLRYQADLAAAASRVDVPTLLISGGRSDLVSERSVQDFLQLVPHAEHVRIADATHMVAGDRNDVFTEAILEFLSAVAQPAAAPTGALP